MKCPVQERGRVWPRRVDGSVSGLRDGAGDELQEVMLRAMSGQLRWFQAAEILGITPRHLLRIRQKYEQFGYGCSIGGVSGRARSGCRWQPWSGCSSSTAIGILILMFNISTRCSGASMGSIKATVG